MTKLKHLLVLLLVGLGACSNPPIVDAKYEVSVHYLIDLCSSCTNLTNTVDVQDWEWKGDTMTLFGEQPYQMEWDSLGFYFYESDLFTFHVYPAAGGHAFSGFWTTIISNQMYTTSHFSGHTTPEWQ